MSTLVCRKPLSDELLSMIYSSDQSMYPAPLSYERLQSWVRACPELALGYAATPQASSTAEENEVIVGAAIVLPVHGQYWRDLAIGNLKEIHLDADTMLSRRLFDEVGLHIFHIEKFDAWRQLGDGYDAKLRPFAEYVEADMSATIREMSWSVLGFSGTSLAVLAPALLRSLVFRNLY
jgi:hypothetical protein